MRAILTTLIILLSASTASGITYREDVPISKFREYGSKHGCVVRIVANVKSTKYRTTASGVIIAPHVVLTAAHCMIDVEDSRVVIGKLEFPIIAAVCPTEYRQHKYGVADLAVCYVRKELPQEFYVKLYDKNNEIGKICSISGWGRSGSFKSGHQSMTKKYRLAGSNYVDSIDRDMLMVSPSRSTDDKTSLECIVSPGDSGGGLFIEGRLAGIHSIITTTVSGAGLTGGYHCKSGSTRVSKFKPWIEKTADQLINYYRLVDEINIRLGYREGLDK
jgi:secreted trypsin-like serine protease